MQRGAIAFSLMVRSEQQRGPGKNLSPTSAHTGGGRGGGGDLSSLQHQPADGRCNVSDWGTAPRAGILAPRSGGSAHRRRRPLRDCAFLGLRIQWELCCGVYCLFFFFFGFGVRFGRGGGRENYRGGRVVRWIFGKCWVYTGLICDFLCMREKWRSKYEAAQQKNELT